MNRFAKLATRTTIVMMVAAASCLTACERDVEREHMTEMKDWMDAICACAAKTGKEAKACAAAHPEPNAVSQTNDKGRIQYKLDSYLMYGQLESAGEECSRKIH